MGFDSQTAKEAGKLSKRGKDNKISAIRDIYANFLENNSSKLQELFDKVAKEDPAKALDILFKMGSFIIPKPKPADIANANNLFLDYSNVPEWLRPKKDIKQLSEKEFDENLQKACKVLEAAGKSPVNMNLTE